MIWNSCGRIHARVGRQRAGEYHGRLENLGVLRWFSHREVSGTFGIKKPDNRFFRTILDRAGFTPSEAIMIGDRLDNDIIPAKKLGLRTIWFRQGRYATLEPRVPDEIPDVTINDLEDLPSAVYSITESN